MRKRPKLGSLLLLIGVLLAHLSYSQTHLITGRVVGKDGQGLEGATVKVEGKPASTMTKADGSYSINAATGSQILISHVGFKVQKFKVTGATSVYNFTLEDEASTIDQVVVTAIGTKTKKREQGYTTTTIKADELVASSPTTLGSALAGKAPGLEITGVGGGVNPSYKISLRGQRSLTGNNNALIILDNIVVPMAVFTNINPDDVADVTTLTGPTATALYGSQGANGALVITTKRGKSGAPQIHISQTTTAEKVAFNPKLQHEYGGGGDGYGITADGQPVYSAVENESYGPHFDGSMKPLGLALEDGSQLYAPYAYFKDRNKFWQTGLTNQTDFSISSGDEKSTMFLSGQFLKTTGTTYQDQYQRANVRINGTRKVSATIDADYSIDYTQNRYNITTSDDALYDQFLNMPANIPITHFKDWKTNKFANPNGYYNPWYGNPYFTIDNNREKVHNDYLVGNIGLKWAPTDWLTLTSRTGMTYVTASTNAWTGSFTYTDFAKTSSGGSKTDIAGSYSSQNTYTNTLQSTFLAEGKKNFNDFSLYVMGGAQMQQDNYTSTYGGISGLVDSGLYNLGNTLNYPSASNSLIQDRTVAAMYQVKLGYKGWIYLNTTGRNDWVSVLAPDNRSFFYPSVDLSFVATDAITALKAITWLDVLKARVAWSKVGEVNLGNTYNAYALSNTYSQSEGYPFNGVAGFTVNGNIANPQLTPEFTKSYEAGLDFTLFQGRIDGSATYFNSHTTRQTITTSISQTSGYSSLTTNAGETSNKGLELRLNVIPIKSKDWTVSITGNYTYNNNRVISLPSTLSSLTLGSSYGNAQSNAVPGYVFPSIFGTDYVRDGKGHVIVDGSTGLPTVNSNMVYLGSAATKDMLGLTPTVRWKQITFSAVLEYRGGFKRYNQMGTDLDWSGMGIRTVKYHRQRFVFPNSVISDGQGGYVKNTSVEVNQGNGNDGFWTNSQNMNVGSNYVTSGSYWKLRQIDISYSLSPNVLKHMGGVIKNLTIGAEGRNLFLWLPKDNYYTDPDYTYNGTGNGIGLTGYQTPPSRYFGGTISVTF